MKVLIGYDGSDGAESALDDLRRAGLSDATERVIVTVRDPAGDPPPSLYEVLGLAEDFEASSPGYGM
jgi:hypothetical protein